jgi:hypothetical protein
MAQAVALLVQWKRKAVARCSTGCCVVNDLLGMLCYVKLVLVIQFWGINTNTTCSFLSLLPSTGVKTLEMTPSISLVNGF